MNQNHLFLQNESPWIPGTLGQNKFTVTAFHFDCFDKSKFFKQMLSLNWCKHVIFKWVSVFNLIDFGCKCWHNLLHVEKNQIFKEKDYSIWIFFHDYSRFTGLQGKGEGISLAPNYHFHPLYRHLDISRAITADSSPLHIGSSPIRTGNLCFPSARR